MVVELDARKLDEKEQAHSYLKEILHFPEYYGNNLDALYDCLTEMDELEVLIVHSQEAVHYYPRIEKIFSLAMKENEKLHMEKKEEPV